MEGVSVRTLAIAVSDTAIGMSAEDIPKIMASFGQLESRVGREYEGSGLGLPLAKHLVELHGGTLTVESQVDVGTTVTIILPSGRIVPEAPPMPAIRAFAWPVGMSIGSAHEASLSALPYRLGVNEAF